MMSELRFVTSLALGAMLFLSAGTACSDASGPEDSALPGNGQPSPAEQPTPESKSKTEEAVIAESPPPAAPPASLDPGQRAQIIEAFNQRLEAYVKIRKEASKGAPGLKQTSDPEKIQARQQQVAARLQQLRSASQPGELLNSDMEKLIRLLIHEAALEGNRIDTAETEESEAQPGQVPLRLNSLYPEEMPVATVLPQLLQKFPPLPENLEYRFVRQHLILLDTETNVIVDYTGDVIP